MDIMEKFDDWMNEQMELVYNDEHPHIDWDEVIGAFIETDEYQDAMREFMWEYILQHKEPRYG